MKLRNIFFWAVGALMAAGCSDQVSDPVSPMVVQDALQPKAYFDQTSTVFTSGSHVDTWDPIAPAFEDPNWESTVCVPQPGVGLGANWTNPHKASVANGAAFQGAVSNIFTADWINSYPTYESYNSPVPLGPQRYNWTRFSTPVSGNGEFVLYLAADNCSWIYLSNADGSNPQLVGVQLEDVRNNPPPTITLGDGTVVGVDLQVLSPDGSSGTFRQAQTQTSGGTYYWTGKAANGNAPYVSSSVFNPPPLADIIGLEGGSSSRYRITFTQPVKDPIMPILSLGQPNRPTTYDFDRQFEIVSNAPGYFSPNNANPTLWIQPGEVLLGREGHGTIRFIGSFDTFSWTVPTSEIWHGFTLGIRTTVATESNSDFDGDGGPGDRRDSSWRHPPGQHPCQAERPGNSGAAQRRLPGRRFGLSASRRVRGGPQGHQGHHVGDASASHHRPGPAPRHP